DIAERQPTDIVHRENASAQLRSANVLGVLRLRRSIAKRSTCSAQDDNFIDDARFRTKIRGRWCLSRVEGRAEAERQLTGLVRRVHRENASERLRSANVVGVLRLRRSSAKRSTCSAQDDNFLLMVLASVRRFAVGGICRGWKVGLRRSVSLPVWCEECIVRTPRRS